MRSSRSAPAAVRATWLLPRYGSPCREQRRTTVALLEAVLAHFIAGKDVSQWDLRAIFALSVASGFVWLVVLASRLTGQSLQAMAGGGVWKVLTETRFGNDWLVRAVLAVGLNNRQNQTCGHVRRKSAMGALSQQREIGAEGPYWDRPERDAEASTSHGLADLLRGISGYTLL